MIECPACEARESRVTDSRKSGQTMRRRRSCAACGARWTTFEVSGADHRTLVELEDFHKRGLAEMPIRFLPVSRS